jgi:nucleoid-associated protein YgaU
MAVKAKSSTQEEKTALGPSVVLGLVGAVFVLLFLAAGIWGVGKIISKVKESGDTSEEEQKTEETTEGETTEEETASEETTTNTSEENETQGTVDEGATTEQKSEGTETSSQEEEKKGTTSQGSQATETKSTGGKWIANNYKPGDIKGGTYTVVRGDTLWEIAEARYGSGFQWGKIRDANLSKIGFLPNGSRALIFPGQVLTLP